MRGLLALVTTLVVTPVLAQQASIADKETAAQDAKAAVRTFIAEMASGEAVVLADAMSAKFMGDDYPIIGRAGFRVVNGELGPYVFVPCQGEMFETSQNKISRFEHECSNVDEIPITTVLVGLDTFSVAKKTPFQFQGKTWQGYVAQDIGVGLHEWAAKDTLSLVAVAKAAANANGNSAPELQKWNLVTAEMSKVGDQKYIWLNPSPAGADVFAWAGLEADKPVLTLD